MRDLLKCFIYKFRALCAEFDLFIEAPEFIDAECILLRICRVLTVVCESLVLEARLCIQFAQWLRMRRMLCRFGDTFFAGSAEASPPREFATLASCSPFNDCRIVADVVHTCGHEVTS